MHHGVGDSQGTQLNRFLASLYNEGVLDRQFDQLRRLQDDDNPGFIVDVLTLFCRELDSIFIKIDRLLERPPLNYPRIVAYVHQLKGSSSSVGGRRVKIYCEEFHTSYEKNDIAGVQLALNRTKQESFRLRLKFQTVIELERKILIDSSHCITASESDVWLSLASSSRCVNES